MRSSRSFLNFWTSWPTLVVLVFFLTHRVEFRLKDCTHAHCMRGKMTELNCSWKKKHTNVRDILLLRFITSAWSGVQKVKIKLQHNLYSVAETQHLWIIYQLLTTKYLCGHISMKWTHSLFIVFGVHQVHISRLLRQLTIAVLHVELIFWQPLIKEMLFCKVHNEKITPNAHPQFPIPKNYSQTRRVQRDSFERCSKGWVW